MENIEVIVNMLSNLAFPICVSVVLWRQNQKQLENYRTDIDNLRKTVDKNSEIMSEQISVLRELKERLL